MVMRQVTTGRHATSATIPFTDDVIVAGRAPGVALCDDAVHVQTHCDVIVGFRLALAFGASVRFPLVTMLFGRKLYFILIYW